MKTIKYFILILICIKIIGVSTVFAQDGGAFSSYLIGTYEKRLGVFTGLYIINPTQDTLRVVIAFYDAYENFVNCKNDILTPNDLLEINVSGEGYGADTTMGVVKIISYEVINEIAKPKLGIVGFQRHVALIPEIALAFSESLLASVPEEFAEAELKKISQDDIKNRCKLK